MLDVCVCVGSSCHLRGSDQVIARLRAIIEERGWQERVNLKGSFCLERCSGGVSVKVGERILTGILPDTVNSELLPEIDSQLGSGTVLAGAQR
jgi:NADH:ubiquinone oxidoreductase subunit E